MVLQGSFSLLLSQSALWWWELLSQQNSCLQLVTWKAPRENFCYYLSLHDLNCLHLKHMTVTAVKSRAWWCLGEKNMKFWSLVGFSCHVSAAGAEGLPALFKSKPQKSVSVSTRSVSDVPVSLVGLHICSSLTSVLPQFCLNTRNVFHLHSQQVFFSFFLSHAQVCNSASVWRQPCCLWWKEPVCVFFRLFWTSRQKQRLLLLCWVPEPQNASSVCRPSLHTAPHFCCCCWRQRLTSSLCPPRGRLLVWLFITKHCTNWTWSVTVTWTPYWD